MGGYMDYKEVSLDTLNSGAVIELFNEEWEKLLENIADENVSADTMRELRIVIKVKPDKNRQTAKTTVEATTKLAPVKPHESFVLLSGDGGRVNAYVSDPKQQELEGIGGNVVEMKGVQKHG